MTTSARTVARPLLAVGVALALVCVVGIAAPVAGQSTADADAGNASFGAQVSSFMQSTAAEANDTVDDGMWRASVDDASSPDVAVTQRADRLRSRLSSLENRSEALATSRDGQSGVAYTARASAVHARIASLRASIDETSRVASAYGVEDTALQTLRDRANDVTGPRVPERAQAVASPGRGPPADVTPGPEGERGPPANRSATTSGNETPTVPGARGQAGPPAESGQPDAGPGEGNTSSGQPGSGGAPPGNGARAPSGGGDAGHPENGGQGGLSDRGDRSGSQTSDGTGPTGPSSADPGQPGHERNEQPGRNDAGPPDRDPAGPAAEAGPNPGPAGR